MYSLREEICYPCFIRLRPSHPKKANPCALCTRSFWWPHFLIRMGLLSVGGCLLASAVGAPGRETRRTDGHQAYMYLPFPGALVACFLLLYLVSGVLELGALCWTPMAPNWA